MPQSTTDNYIVLVMRFRSSVLLAALAIAQGFYAKGNLVQIVDTRFMMIHQGFLELQADLVQIGDTRFMKINQGFLELQADLVQMGGVRFMLVNQAS